MLDSLTKGIAKVFGGTKAEKDLKELTPYIGKINAEFEKLRNITDDELREKTTEFKQIIKDHLKSIDDQIESLHKDVNENQDLDVHQKEDIFAQIDKLEDERDVELEKVLIDILPQAFAVVKETSRRLAENEKLTVQATQHDKEVAAKKSNVEINGELAIWHNKWSAAGTDVVWNMVHYDVQLVGGVVSDHAVPAGEFRDLHRCRKFAVVVRGLWVVLVLRRVVRRGETKSAVPSAKAA
ncbi:MAG: hypothetical protein AAF391_06310 [Bacteroidota bacterium]